MHSMVYGVHLPAVKGRIAGYRKRRNELHLLKLTTTATTKTKNKTKKRTMLRQLLEMTKNSCDILEIFSSVSSVNTVVCILL